MRLEHALVLNRYFHALFGARDLTALKQPLNVQESRAADGPSVARACVRPRWAVRGGCTTDFREKRKQPETGGFGT